MRYVQRSTVQMGSGSTCSTRAPRRESAKVPSGFDTTAVPTLTTIRRALDNASRSAGISSDRSLSHALAEPTGKFCCAGAVTASRRRDSLSQARRSSVTDLIDQFAFISWRTKGAPSRVTVSQVQELMPGEPAKGRGPQALTLSFLTSPSGKKKGVFQLSRLLRRHK